MAVLTRPDARSGRGRKESRSPVAERADAAGLPVLQPRSPREPEFLEQLAGLAVDCAPVVAYGALVPQAALDLPRHGWVNLHFSLLPAWRGAAPVQHAIMAGDEITGASTFRLEAGLDTGPVFGTVTEPIGPRDTAGDLLGRLAVSGAGLLVATLDGIADGSLVAQPQPADGISSAPKVEPADAQLDWSLPAHVVDRRIRGLTPTPGAWTTWRGDRLRLGPVEPLPDVELPVGEVSAGPAGVLVGTGRGTVRLGDVQPAGKRMFPAADWARGARPAPGERMGA
ncbi:MAG: methionyl-tRNA formyltransferase [Blastococcus sp.]|nr:methionyl-tRNA formyltransferase [Blastococcus sp.]